jgi:hypothetical protein
MSEVGHELQLSQGKPLTLELVLRYLYYSQLGLLEEKSSVITSGGGGVGSSCSSVDSDTEEILLRSSCRIIVFTCSTTVAVGDESEICSIAGIAILSCCPIMMIGLGCWLGLKGTAVEVATDMAVLLSTCGRQCRRWRLLRVVWFLESGKEDWRWRI